MRARFGPAEAGPYICTLLLTLGLSAQQTGPSTGTGLILGQVVDARDGRPIAGAFVTMRGTVMPGLIPGPGSITNVRTAFAQTDSQGRFVFSNLPAGAFELTVTAGGYLMGLHGQQRPAGGSRPVVLQADQKLGGVKITMWKAGVITGTITDDRGDALVNASVSVFARVNTGQSVRLTPLQTVRTDDRGVYRASGLWPGDYVIKVPSSIATFPDGVVQTAEKLSAVDLKASIAPMPTADGVRVAGAYLQPIAVAGGTLEMNVRGDQVFMQPTVFFPGTPNPGEAAVVPIAAGEERSAVDFQIRTVPAFTVSGTIIGPSGPGDHLGVRLLPANLDEYVNDAGIAVATTLSAANGAFTLMAVPPGSYYLRVVRVPGAAVTQADTDRMGPSIFNGVVLPRPAPPSEPTLFANVPVTVGADVTNLSVPLRIGPRLSGRVEFEGNGARPSLGAGARIVTVTLVPADGGMVDGGIIPAIVGTDGRFSTMSVPPGRYRVTASADSWTLRSAELNGRDISDARVELDAGNVGGVVVRFFDRPAQLSGVVQNVQGEPDVGVTVCLFPADYRAWIAEGATPRRYRRVRTGAGGRYTMNGLIPGDYMVIAVADDPSDGPAFVEAASPVASRMSLGDGSRQTQNLTTRQIK